MLATVLVAALNLSAGQGATLGAFQLAPPLLLSADLGLHEEQKPQEHEVPSSAVSATAFQGVGWRIAGAAGMAVLGAIPGTLIVGETVHTHGDLTVPVGLTVMGTVFFGVIGYALGLSADEGSEGARSAIVALDILAVAIGTHVVSSSVATANAP